MQVPGVCQRLRFVLAFPRGEASAFAVASDLLILSRTGKAACPFAAFKSLVSKLLGMKKEWHCFKVVVSLWLHVAER